MDSCERQNIVESTLLSRVPAQENKNFQMIPLSRPLSRALCKRWGFSPRTAVESTRRLRLRQRDEDRRSRGESSPHNAILPERSLIIRGTWMCDFRKKVCMCILIRLASSPPSHTHISTECCTPAQAKNISLKNGGERGREG